MKLPFKPHLLVLVCSAGLFAASGVMFVKGRATEPAAPAPVAQQPAAPAPAAAQPAPVVAPAYTAAQIDQWVAPIALYPDALLSQILMASTYPANVIQAAQWSKDNPKMEGDAAIQAVIADRPPDRPPPTKGYRSPSRCGRAPLQWRRNRARRRGCR